MLKKIKHKLFGQGEFSANLVRGAVGSLGVKLGSTLLGLVLAVLLARHLGAAGYGTYAFVLAAVSLMAIPTQLGLPTLVVRETAKAQVNAQWGVMRGLWCWASLTVGSISLLLAMVAVLIGLVFTNHFEANQLATFAWGIVLIPLIALGNLRGAALRGLRRVVLGQLPEFILRPALLSLLIFAAVLYLAPSRLTSAHAMGLHVVAAALAFVTGAFLLWRSRPQELKDRPHPEYPTREWFAAALPLALVSGMQLINQNTDIILLGLMRSAEEVGIYKVVVTGATLVAFGLQAITLSISPYLARLHTQGDKQRLQRLVTLSARGILLFALPIVLVLVVWGEAVLEIIFGAEYASGKTALAILALGQLVNAGMGSVGMLLTMTGHERETARAVMIAAVLNVSLNLLLIPLWGINGAALSGALTLTVWNLVMWRAVRRHLGIESMAFSIFPTKRAS
jgi:O-antigen/teichoic acid export membrane protein